LNWTIVADLKLEYGHGTHVGLRRDHNEDTYCVDPQLGLWLVADGMGGHEHGEVASALARDTVLAKLREGKPLNEAIRLADIEIISHSKFRGETLPMGTTVACARLWDNKFEVAWVGDSRVYLFDGHHLKQLTHDHSYVQELVSQGAITAEQAKTHPHRNVVTQALGVTDPASLNVDIVTGELGPGQRLLICSDGLTEEVEDEQIDAILRKDLSLQEAVEQLLVAALDGGGSDNVTVLLVGALK
jgi:PPM family protein phosphatase